MKTIGGTVQKADDGKRYSQVCFSIVGRTKDSDGDGSIWSPEKVGETIQRMISEKYENYDWVVTAEEQ